MRVNIKENSSKIEGFKFPCILKRKDSGVIFLVDKDNQVIYLCNKESFYFGQLGSTEFHNSPSNIDYELFKGKIEISND